MRIESLSIRTITVIIFLMIGTVASILSLFAGNYFRQAALNAQVSSLSRVIEVASQEMLKSIRSHTFDLGMRLAHSEDIIRALQNANQQGSHERLVSLLDDPFVNGFVGFANINLEKIRIYDLNLNLVAESSKGSPALPKNAPPQLAQKIKQRSGVERLKAIDALWIAPQGPLHSSLLPIGGLRLIGYLEIIINPVFNLPDIGTITQTPISIFTPAGKPILTAKQEASNNYLPVEYILPSSDGVAAFKIVGYEDVRKLNAEMDKTRFITVGSFLLLTFCTLLAALWLFNRFLFQPFNRMMLDMKQMAAGKLDLTVDKSGLRDFAVLADTFNGMARQVRQHTNDLERLLDLDDSAILCFGKDQEAVYFNRGALALLGYAADEIGDLDLGEVFVEDIASLMQDAATSMPAGGYMQARLNCMRKDGSRFQRNAVLRALDMQDGNGLAVVLYAQSKADEALSAEAVFSSFQRNEQRMNAVEQSLNSLLEIARNAPGFMSNTSAIELAASEDMEPPPERPAIREQAVNVMLCSLACWEHDLDKSKLDLAEESGIWPVYIDKSTPTTRTLDKYLNIETCPKNPRSQRVIDTAEFVLKQLGRKSSEERKKLQQTLNDFRLLLSGIKSLTD